jgi:hypothetical protein
MIERVRDTHESDVEVVQARLQTLIDAVNKGMIGGGSVNTQLMVSDYDYEAPFLQMGYGEQNLLGSLNQMYPADATTHIDMVAGELFRTIAKLYLNSWYCVLHHASQFSCNIETSDGQVRSCVNEQPHWDRPGVVFHILRTQTFQLIFATNRCRTAACHVGKVHPRNMLV